MPQVRFFIIIFSLRQGKQLRENRNNSEVQTKGPKSISLVKPEMNHFEHFFFSPLEDTLQPGVKRISFDDGLLNQAESTLSPEEAICQMPSDVRKASVSSHFHRWGQDVHKCLQFIPTVNEGLHKDSAF